MNKKIFIKKGVVFAVILLFISVSVIPSTGTTDVKRITMPTSFGNILYVGGDGPGNYTKIQDAIDDASDGDTVFVYNDSSPYYENVVVDKSINLIGEDKYTTVIDGDNWEYVVKITANNVTIRGFTIQSLEGIWTKGIYVGANNTEISHNIIQNLGYGITEFGNVVANLGIHNNIFRNNHYGIEFFHTTHNIIFNNSFRDNTYGGFDLYYSNNNTIYNNSFFHDGLHIEDSYNNIVYNNTINNKPIIYLENAKNMVVEHAGQVLLFKCKNIIVRNCYFNDTLLGIHLCSTNHCNIINNTFTNTTESGCFLDYTWNTLIHGNLFSPKGGLRGWLCVNTVIKYNTFVCCYGALGFEYMALLTKILHNNFINNRVVDIVFLLSFLCQVKHNYWDRPRFLPKIIHVGANFTSRILIDWRPAWKPNNISTPPSHIIKHQYPSLLGCPTLNIKPSIPPST